LARIESVAVGGFYPTPSHLLPSIVGLLRFPTYENEEKWRKAPAATIVDPCAGEGVALIALATAAAGGGRGTPVVYSCELESTRCEALKKNLGVRDWHWSNLALSGDAFRATFEASDEKGASILYLNPPYDYDREFGRLEHRFLDRFASILAPGGVLLYVVPHYALSASAKMLARDFDSVLVFRFPVDEFVAYKQVVLVATRRVVPLFEPSSSTLAMLLAASTDAERFPELPSTSNPFVDVPCFREYEGGLKTWKMQNVDVVGLRSAYRPWHKATRNGTNNVPIEDVLPSGHIQDMLLRRYPVATPPRPAHIASGIASGIFNGSRLVADRILTTKFASPAPLPDLLVKGVFDREYKTIEEKRNKDGEITGEVQVQQPRLVTTVLDLETHRYHVLGAEATGKREVATMGVPDLLAFYGGSLAAVMEKNCPISYDPRKHAAEVPIPVLGRNLFVAQAHATRALVRLLGGPGATRRARKGKVAYLLGEIGSGKTSCALATAKAVGAREVLVLCPPHLLQSWTDEARAVIPEGSVDVVSTVEDVDAFARKAKTSGVRIAVVSREAAKLGHGWGAVEGYCPRCEHPTPSGVDLAKTRARCTHQALEVRDELARECEKLAILLEPHAPGDERVRALLPTRAGRARRKAYAARLEADGGKARLACLVLPEGFLDAVAGLLLVECIADAFKASAVRALVAVLVALGDSERFAYVARAFVAQGGQYQHEAVGRELLRFVAPDARAEIRAERKSFGHESYYSSWSSDAWNRFEVEIADAGEDGKVHDVYSLGCKVRVLSDGTHEVNGVASGSFAALLAAFEATTNVAKFGRGVECGEPLHYAVPEPRRVPLARYVQRKYPDLFDLLVIDECHEANASDSATSHAVGRLMSIGVPTILMTGSVMNGYAESLFANQWATSPTFRAEFDRDQKAMFVTRYGYKKRVVEDKEEGKVVAFGSHSDRVVRSERVVGHAPGVLPLFLFRHLLRQAVTLHKSDLAIDLPECRQERIEVEMIPELRERYVHLLEQLKRCIKADMFEPGLSGKLFGQLSELPSYLDRACEDAGTSDRVFRISYPDSCGGQTVASVPFFPASTTLPKEQRMLDLLEEELRAGRNVMVFAWHVSLLPRLARLARERTGEEPALLFADKVAPAKRQEWIDREVVRKNRRVLVTNPVCIQTGLNNLVHFSTEVWLENPACNPVVFRQAIGRVDRIGQKRPTRIVSLTYADSLQAALHDLLMKKVAVSVSTDGLDNAGALEAAGVGESEYIAGLSIGRQIWKMISGDE